MVAPCEKERHYAKTIAAPVSALGWNKVFSESAFVVVGHTITIKPILILVHGVDSE